MELKKLISALAIVMPLITFTATASAQVEVIHASGRYVVGDGPEENLLVAKQRARKEAKRRAAEMAGVYVQSYSKVVNLSLVEDEIVTVAAQILKIKQEDVRYSNTADGSVLMITCDIVAEVDTDNILFEGKQNADLALTSNPVVNNAASQNMPAAGKDTTVKTVEVASSPVKPIENKAVTPAVPVQQDDKRNIVDKHKDDKDVLPEIVSINKSVSVKPQAVKEVELMQWDFIRKPADYVYDKNTKLLKTGSVKFVPDPKRWECLGVRKFPHYYNRDGRIGFGYYIDCIMWVSPESVVKRGNKISYKVAMYESVEGKFKVSNYMIDFDEQYQIMLTGKEYDASKGNYEKEDTQRSKGVKMPFNDRTEKKDLLHQEQMRKYLTLLD